MSQPGEDFAAFLRDLPAFELAQMRKEFRESGDEDAEYLRLVEAEFERRVEEDC